MTPSSDTSLDERPEKSFVYLVQSRGPLPDVYADIEHEQADRIVLSWREPVEGGLFAPGTTWTEGRNRLLAEALARGTRYHYYIFLDDDVAFERGGWREFEEALMRYEPAVASPYFPWYRAAMLRTNQALDAHTFFWFDAMYNAFHRDVVEDGFVLPYIPDFDGESWWYSQFIVICMVHALYHRDSLQFNKVWVGNTKHEDYPQGDDFKKVIKWIHNEVLRTPPAWTWRSRAAGVLRRLGGTERPSLPRPKTGSYRLTDDQKARLLRLDSAYWASRA
jgi:hypothetical protein